MTMQNRQKSNAKKKKMRLLCIYKLSGVSLAQDRGSLEAKAEAQKSEISMLKKQLEVKYLFIEETY